MVSKVVIITGASRGIGLAVTNSLIKASHRVVLVSRSSEQLERLKEQFPSQVKVLVADMTQAEVGPSKRLLEANLTPLDFPEGDTARRPVIWRTGRRRHQPWCAISNDTSRKCIGRRLEEAVRCQYVQRTRVGKFGKPESWQRG